MTEEPGVTSQGEWSCLRVHLQPRASRNEVCGMMGPALKVRVTSPPVDDRANRQLVDFLAELLELPARDVSILKGARSRNKTVGFRGIDPVRLQRKIHYILYH
jgi:uncharacterized protein